jgi:hypothetical protein
VPHSINEFNRVDRSQEADSHRVSAVRVCRLYRCVLSILGNGCSQRHRSNNYAEENNSRSHDITSVNGACTILLMEVTNCQKVVCT